MALLYTEAAMSASSPDTHIADAPAHNWVERLLPPAALPYAQLMRLDRPIGWWLLLLPCWWGLALAMITVEPDALMLWYAALFLAGAIVMRGAGCVLNDLADRDIDGQVERTRNRPLPSGRISARRAIVFLIALLLAGFVILLQFNGTTIVTGIASLAIVAVYPFMKRITHWPQAVLGLAFNWGALVGWTAVTGALSAAPFFLYAGGVFWTLAYDTIYAHQDKDDDALIGVKSTALLFGETTRRWLIGFFAASLACFAAACFAAGAGPLSYVGLAAAAFHAAWQCRRFDGADGALCLKLFRSNRTFGLIMLFGLIADGILT
jgi:4-hydroxybenzoate polyprenyltransferase